MKRSSQQNRRSWRSLLALPVGFAVISTAAWAVAQQPPAGGLSEPVFRVSKNDGEDSPDAHPLDPALRLAQEGLRNIRENVEDYTCILVKRERIDGELRDYEYMFCKVRQEKRMRDQVVDPFAVYMYFLAPDDMKGREVIWVKGENNGKLIAHESPNRLIQSRFAVWLRPESALAMRGNLYPISEVGIENLIVKLIEKGERDRQYGEVEVEFHEGANVNGRVCTMLEVRHPVPRPYFDFHIARIYIDDELQVPIRYAAFSWPETEGGDPVLLEEYTYLKLNLNVGLTDEDFDPENPNYRF